MYILDEDPCKSASYLIKQHIYKYITDLEYSFTYYNLKKIKPINSSIVLQECIIYSKENYLWFSKFYEELKKLYNKFVVGKKIFINNFDESFLYNLNNIEFKNTGLKLPKALDSFINKFNRYIYHKYVKDLTNPIDINRIMYIINNYKVDSFMGTIPPWYSSVSNIIYSSYNKKDRNRVKIIFEDGKYKYFISFISDKWTEVKDVPPEIKYFINSVLYT
jgi:hypothetical protein